MSLSILGWRHLIEVMNRRRFKLSLLCAVLALGACLRLAGLSWGLQRGYHPDEMVSMRGVVQVDLLAADFTVPAAYFEGTFNYYLWSLPVAAIRLLGLPDQSEWKPIDEAHLDEAHFGWILFLSRLMTVAFDTVTILVVFLAVTEAVNAFYPALFGAFLYAVIPMQVIYAHFMRPHILSNLLCALVVWLSFKLIRTRKWWLFLSAGILSGLAAATRYPAGIIAVLPCLCIMFAPVGAPVTPARRFWERIRYLVSGPLWWIGLGFILGCLRLRLCACNAANRPTLRSTQGFAKISWHFHSSNWCPRFWRLFLYCFAGGENPEEFQNKSACAGPE